MEFIKLFIQIKNTNGNIRFDLKGSFFLADNKAAMKDFNDKIYEFIKKEDMVN